MKKIFTLFLLISLFISCNDDDDLTGIAVSFFPTQVANAVEEDGITYRLILEASGIIGNREAFADVSVSLTNEGVIFTEPALNNGLIRVVFAQDTIDSGNGPRVETVGVIEVTVLNDAIPFDYDAEFTITGVGGVLSSISSANTFTLKVEDDDTAPLFFEDFENGLGDWTIINTDGNNTWTTTTFDGNTSALSSTFNSDSPALEDNWLISPAIDFDTELNESLSFLSKTRFNDEENRLEVSILTNFDGSDPEAATKTVLNPTLDPHTGGGFGDFTESGDLDLSQIQGTGHIAFRFKAINDQDASGWEVDDVELNAFDPDGSGGGSSGGNGGGSGDAITSLNEDFESYPDAGSDFIPFSADGWVNFTEAGSRAWVIDDEDGNKQVEFTAFNSAESSNIGWLILPKINFDGLVEQLINFQTETQFGDANTQLDLLHSSDFDGTSGGISSANWVEIAFTVASGSDAGFIESGDIDLSSFMGEGYLAFRYTGDGTNDQNDATYVIDNIILGSSSGSGGGGGGSDEFFTLPFFDDFEDCTDDFSTPSNWIEAFVSGAKTDRGWGCRQEGVNDSRAVRASAFGGDPGTDNAWLITAQKVDLSSESSAFLTFDIKSAFDGAGMLNVFYSATYDSGDPSLASWMELSDVSTQLPTKGSDTYTTVSTNLSSALGSEVYIAFQYSGATNDNSASYEIDNISINATGPTSTVGFGVQASTQNETNATFTIDVPVTLSNYGGSQVELNVSVSGGTAEAEDYVLNTTSLTFTSDGTQNISLSINADADADKETIEITLSESTSTGVTINPSVHVLTINDDEASSSTLLEDGFEGCSDQFGVPDGWIEEVVSGAKTDRGWGCRDDKARNGDYAVRASAFGGNDGTDNTYLIYGTPINFDSQTGETATFWAKAEFSGAGTLTLEYSNDYSGSGDPSSATWNTIEINLPDQGVNTYAEVTGDLSGIAGTAYIAFHFEGATSDDSVSWDLDDLVIESD